MTFEDQLRVARGKLAVAIAEHAVFAEYVRSQLPEVAVTVPTPGPPISRPQMCSVTHFEHPNNGVGLPGRLGPCEKPYGHTGPHLAQGVGVCNGHAAAMVEALAEVSR